MTLGADLPRLRILSFLSADARTRLEGDPAMLRVLLHIEAKPARAPSEAEAARLYGGTILEFCVGFESLDLGRFGPFVWTYRRALAKLWLEETDLREEVIAQLVGYSSDATLSRAYKRSFRAAPRRPRG